VVVSLFWNTLFKLFEEEAITISRGWTDKEAMSPKYYQQLFKNSRRRLGVVDWSIKFRTPGIMRLAFGETTQVGAAPQSLRLTN
jgi:hypothetical protein